VSVVIIRLTVLTYYVWIAVTGESGRSYLKAWLEALGEDRARRLPTRSPTSADPSTRRSSTSSRLGGTCDKKAKLCSIPLEDKQAVLLPLREFMLARVQLPLHGGAYRYHLGRGTPAARHEARQITPASPCHTRVGGQGQAASGGSCAVHLANPDSTSRS
jgi:hypothetical protein